ncbi:tripartite tricarboxylate transporter substrate binding protein [Vineibacter terrae]|uniref:Bug family tripartite tricarboxylate transporter substrate binding protein n=1 Tax=Vineibacter terrae TaxID=2586908 RepID=UPI002E329ED5|nr:tripartite tricarboxylate transporter substrate binding protein [Vineibacter terrae]HEX2888447.1 tripartite tricarboxylate transporter substrate binding protein [Vineibacter terrae]
MSHFLGRISRRQVLAGGTAAAIFHAVSPAFGSPWRPTQQVRIVVPAAPGGGTDILARLLADHLGRKWGQSVIVDNRSGAGGVIGSTEVARAAPDGHTILMGNIGAQSIAYSLYRNMPYGPDSLVPVSNVLLTPNVLVVHPSVPARTVPEFVAWLKDQKGKASFASSGTGQSPHLAGAWFLQLTGTQATHVPYRGAAPALNDLVSGVTQFFFDNLTTSIEFIRSGKLRALGLTSAQPNSSTPDLLPIRDTMPQLREFDVSAWFATFLPGKTPQPVVEALNAEVKDLLAQDAMKERVNQMAGLAAWSPPAEFARFVHQQIGLWRSVIDREGLKLEVN